MEANNKKNYSTRLHNVIPGGAHTYSRGDDQFPTNAPAILARGKGSFVWDREGNKFLDYGMALRAITLGYANEEVNEAAFEEIKKGNNLTRASFTELKAAELLRDLIPGVDMVKFAKNGSNVTSAAVKLARAYTGKKYIAVCAEQPFFSFDDWFIGTTAIQRGVPSEHHALTLKFNYNKIESLEKLFTDHPGQIAGVMLEPVTSNLNPYSSKNSDKDSFRIRDHSEVIEPNFLQLVKELCHKNGAVFILDEMISGFRWHLQGAQKFCNVVPDLTTLGKGMANGFSVAALAGKKEIMELGGITEEGMERTFSISTTHGAEMCGLGAFIKCVELYQTLPVIDHLWKFGAQLIDGMNSIAKENGIEKQFYFEGFPCSPNYVTKNQDSNLSLEFRTLFSQEMIKEKILMPWVSICYAHEEEELEITLNAARKVLKIYAEALDKGVEKYLIGRAIKPVFRKYN
jgi:glutamate-1-semialdehyde 2,1-aminomutase